MVRPDRAIRLMRGGSRCIELAGASPAAASAGSPRGRSRASRETPPFEWGVRSPPRVVRRAGGEQVRRPSVKRTLHDLIWRGDIVRGWGGHFRAGNGSGKFQAEDRRVHQRLLRLPARRGGQRRWRPDGEPLLRSERPHGRFVKGHGLYQLLGTTRYPRRHACRR